MDSSFRNRYKRRKVCIGTTVRELGGCVCPRSDQCVKKRTTGKLFSRLDLDTVVFHEEALYKFKRTFQKHSMFVKEQS